MQTNETGRGLGSVRVGAFPAQMRSMAMCLACACALVAVRPQPALAGWPLAGSARVTIPFGALYPTGSGESRHRGADLEAAAGEQVRAPFAGTVSFVGRVPAVGGGTVLAMTLDTVVGHVTLLPLERTDVARGAAVAEDAAIGVLAVDGDGSSAGTHLHVGLREGDLYVDPLGVLAPPPAPNADDGAGEGVVSDAGAGAGVVAGGVTAGGAVGGATAGGVAAGGVTAGGVTAGGVTGGVAAPSGQGSALGMPAGVSLAPSGAQVGSPANPPTGAGELAPGVSLAVRGLSAPAGAPSASAPFSSPSSRAPRAARELQPYASAGTRTTASARDESRARSLDAMSAGLSALAERVRIAAARGARAGAYALLGVLGGIGTLWPLWRGARKGIGKVRVSVGGDDVAAAQTR